MLQTLPNSHREKNTGVELRVQVLVLAPAAHSCNILALFPFPDQGSMFSACHSKHPEKSASRKTEEPGAHHSFPSGTSLPHQGRHRCLSSGDPWLSERGVTCQEAIGKPYPDHHQHRQKTQPKHWGSSLFPICWQYWLARHQCHLQLQKWVAIV